MKKKKVYMYLPKIFSTISRALFPFYPRKRGQASNSLYKTAWILNIIFAIYILIMNVIVTYNFSSEQNTFFHYNNTFFKEFLYKNTLLWLPFFAMDIIPASLFFILFSGLHRSFVADLRYTGLTLTTLPFVLITTYIVMQTLSLIYRWLLFVIKTLSHFIPIKYTPLKIITAILLTIFIPLGAINFLYWFYLWKNDGLVPSNWARYNNSDTSHYYSFSYPPNWVVNECGKGEVAVSRKPVSKCYDPLEAPPDYLENVYFQTFMPNKHGSISFEKADPPDSLKDWHTTFFRSSDIPSNLTLLNMPVIPLAPLGGYRHMYGSSFPVNIEYPLVSYSDDNKQDLSETKTSYLVDFIVGYYPHPEYKKELRWVQISLDYHFN